MQGMSVQMWRHLGAPARAPSLRCSPRAPAPRLHTCPKRQLHAAERQAEPSVDDDATLSDLEVRLQDAVRSEDFKLAARLRDAIQ